MIETEADVDVLVIGGGMAGLTTGARAAQLGASVAVVESTDGLGGSAALSGGYVWTAPDMEAFLDEDPHGDTELFQPVLDGYDAAFAWVVGLGVSCAPPETNIKGFGIGRQIDIGQYIRRLRAVIESGGGWISLGTDARSLILRDGRVVGATVRNDEVDSELLARVTVIATGGFQADPELRERYIASAPGALVLRSNERSRGDGIRMAVDAGAALTSDMDGYYGHLIPYPLDRFEPADHTVLAQYQSEFALLLDRDGHRFTDESLGDHYNAEAVGEVGSALMLIDERVRRDEVLKTYMSGMAGVDKLAEGGARGAHYATASTLEEVARAAAAWGYDPAGVLDSVAAYNAHCRGEAATLSPPRKRYRFPIDEPPFAVLEVQSAITFTYGGVRSDADGRVLTGDGTPVAGLYVAGVDAGGVNHRGYTGGLIRGLVLGKRLGEHLTSAVLTDIPNRPAQIGARKQ